MEYLKVIEDNKKKENDYKEKITEHQKIIEELNNKNKEMEYLKVIEDNKKKEEKIIEYQKIIEKLKIKIKEIENKNLKEKFIHNKNKNINININNKSQIIKKK